MRNDPTPDAAVIFDLSGELQHLLACEKEAVQANDRQVLYTSRPEDGTGIPYQEVLTLDEIRRRIAETENALRAAAGR